MPLPLKDFPLSGEDVAQRQKGDKVSPKVTERAPPLPCGELPPQRLRGLQIGEARKMRLAKRLAFFRFDFSFGVERGEQPLSRCGVGGVQRQGGGSRNTPPYLWPSGASLHAYGKQKLSLQNAHFSGSLLVPKENISARLQHIEIAAPLPSGASLTERHSSSALRIASFTTAYANPRRCSAATTRSRRPAASLFL